MYAVLGEDESDARMLKVLIRRLLDDTNIKIQTKGFDGCAQLRRKGARQLKLFAALGYQRFIICHDADEQDPARIRQEVMDLVVTPFGVAANCCVVVPVQEIEAWILADVEAVSKVFTSWRPKPPKHKPETIRHPKEALERSSRINGKRPIYAHATHNPVVAQHLDLERVRQSCPSFRTLFEFVKN